MIPVRIGRLSLRIHVVLALIAGGLALLGGDIWLRYLLLVGALFVHELTHALVALGLGGKRAIVSLWPWGGVAHVDAFGDMREAAVALAAPAANLAIAAAAAWSGGRFDLMLGQCSLLDFVFTTNLMMGAGNLIPLPFLDGGRAFRIFCKAGPR